MNACVQTLAKIVNISLLVFATAGHYEDPYQEIS